MNAPAPKRRGRPATGKQPLAHQIRGRPEWKAWLEACAAREGISASQLVEKALAEYANGRDLPAPPARG